MRLSWTGATTRWPRPRPGRRGLTDDHHPGDLAAGQLARSRHASVRSLQRYARLGPETIARHLAATGPAARRAPASPVTSTANFS